MPILKSLIPVEPDDGPVTDDDAPIPNAGAPTREGESATEDGSIASIVIAISTTLLIAAYCLARKNHEQVTE